MMAAHMLMRMTSPPWISLSKRNEITTIYSCKDILFRYPIQQLHFAKQELLRFREQRANTINISVIISIIMNQQNNIYIIYVICKCV